MEGQGRTNEPKKHGRGYVPLHKYLDLTVDDVSQIELLLLRGRPPFSIAKVVQDEWKKCLKVSLSALSKKIESYRDIEHKKIVVTAAAQIAQPEQQLLLQQHVEEVDAMRGLERMAAVQESRVNKYLERERLMPIPLSDTGKEIERLVMTYEKIGNMQMEMGIVHRTPRRIQAMVISSEDRHRLQESMAQQDALAAATREAIGILESLEPAEPVVVTKPAHAG